MSKIKEIALKNHTLSIVEAAPVPLFASDVLDPALSLDGRHGSSRALGKPPLIAATTDVEAVRAWLARFADTRTTFDSYRKEAERLLLWSALHLGKSLSSLTHEDLLQYQAFLANPQPADRWVLAGRRKVSRSDPRWRPFAGPLSPTSQRQAIIILNAMFSWLAAAGYLAGNPLSLSRQRARKARPRITRYLDPDLWNEVKQTIAALPQETERARAHYNRLRWLFSLLYLCGLRISEVAGNGMHGFFCRRTAKGVDRWWLEITGKGDKLRIVPASSELMQELMRYRRSVGLAALPSANEETPLLLTISGRSSAMTRGAIHALIKQVFTLTAQRLRQQGAETVAEKVAQASAHWLRHTAASHMANNAVDLRHVRDNLGHASLTTTSHYLHSADDERHRATEELHRLSW